MPLDNGFPEILRQYLSQIGHSPRFVQKQTLGTRLFHDLDVYGDTADEYMILMSEEFNVDLTGFDFEKYFPTEFYQGSFFALHLCTMFPSRWVRFRYFEPISTFKPLTLRMIQNALETKKWNYD